MAGLLPARSVFVFNVDLGTDLKSVPSEAFEFRKTKSPFSIGEIVKAELS